LPGKECINNHSYVIQKLLGGGYRLFDKTFNKIGDFNDLKGAKACAELRPGIK